MISSTELLEALSAAIYTTDAEGRITFYNQAAADLWGCRPELGSSQWCGSWRLYWPDGRPMPHDQCPMAVALKEGRPIRGAEAVAERPDGTRVPFRPYPTPLKDASGRTIGAINLLVDISGHKEAEIESARLVAIVTSSDDAIISKTLDGRITSWNQGATRIFGYEAGEMIGQSILRIIPPELHKEEEEILAKLRRGEHIDHYETVRLAKDGRRIDISITVSPLREKSGRIIGASKVARDISERKQAEKMQQLLLGELNHRIKNTLASIQAIANESLRRANSPGEFVSSFTGRIHALAKAHTLLSESKLQGAHVSDLMREQVLLGAADNRITCSGPLVRLDAQSAVQLGLVLHELATNARKYGALSVPVGQLSVRWEVQTNSGKRLFLEWKESEGPAVRAPSKHGFGTMLIERTLRSQGGEVSLAYGADGVCCRIWLPLPPEAELGIQSPGLTSGGFKTPSISQPRSELSGKRILVIEDEPLVSMDIGATLSDLGCKVVGPAGTLKSARELISDERCDAALVDLNLEGEPVDELAALLTRKGVPFALVTGYRRESLPAGFREALVVGKPFRPEELIATVHALITGQRSASSGIIQFKPKS